MILSEKITQNPCSHQGVFRYFPTSCLLSDFSWGLGLQGFDLRGMGLGLQGFRVQAPENGAKGAILENF